MLLKALLTLASLASVTVYHRQRRSAAAASRWKPQRRFRVRLTDNSDAPFVHHWTPCNVNRPSGMVSAVKQSAITAPNSAPKQCSHDPHHHHQHHHQQQQQQQLQQQQHPFDQVIRGLIQHNLADVSPPVISQAELPASLEQTPLHQVRTPAQLQSMAARLRQASELALDTEHHSLHSYLGITCLMQVSTGEEDWVVDTLALHDHMHLLRDVFSDPGILKVLHGAANDILFLQRDFHLYLVNVFDTEKACQVLGKQQRGLAHLLATYCGISQDKSFQHADWRTRPLTPEQLRYARTDAHYLLYLAGQLRRELAAAGQLLAAAPACAQGTLLQGAGGSDASVSAPASTPESGVGGASRELSAPGHASAYQRACERSQLMTLQLFRKTTSEAAATAAATNIWRKHVQSGTAAAQWSTGPAPHSQQQLQGSILALCRWRDATARAEDESPQAILLDLLLLSVARARPATPKALVKLLKEHPVALASAASSGYSGSAARTQAKAICALLAAAAGAEPSACNNSNRAVNNASTAKAEGKPKDWIIKKFAAKSEVYQNARMLSKDGELLCYCDTKKIEWYLSKGIAELVADDPPAIRLLFDHQNTDQLAGNAFYSQRKQNRCVACGDSSHYLRYRVVPSCYRRNFPAHLKSHRSHDVVLLCVACLQLAHKAAERTKRELAAQYGVPLFAPRQPTPAAASANGIVNRAVSADVHKPGAGRRAALALQKAAGDMPQERIRELEDIVKTCLGRDPAAEAAGLRPGDLEAALLDGLGQRKRLRLLAAKNSNSNDNTPSLPLQSAPPPPPAAPPGSAAAPPSVDPATPKSSAKQEAGGGHWWHGARVVEAALARGGDAALNDLTRRFRASFKEVLNPHFLPDSWDVNHAFSREFGDYSVYRRRQDGEPQDQAGAGGQNGHGERGGDGVQGWDNDDSGIGDGHEHGDGDGDSTVDEDEGEVGNEKEVGDGDMVRE